MPARVNVAHVGSETGVTKLGVEMPLEHRTCNWTVLPLRVRTKRTDDARRIASVVPQALRQVEQVASLPALVERPQLRGQQLVHLKCRDRRRPFEPAGSDAEWTFRIAQDGPVLTRVDFDLQPQLHGRRAAGLEAVAEGHTPLRLSPTWLAEPWTERRLDHVHHCARRTRLHLNQIDVFRVARRRRQIQLV